MPSGWYWSSSQVSDFDAWNQRFSDGYLCISTKDFGSSLRACEGEGLIGGARYGRREPVRATHYQRRIKAALAVGLKAGRRRNQPWSGSEATMEVMNLQDLHVYNEDYGKATPDRIKSRPEIHFNATKDFGPANPTGDHIKNFIEAVKYGKPLNCDARLGHEAAVTGHLATMSLRRDKKVFWDAEKQKYTLS